MKRLGLLLTISHIGVYFEYATVMIVFLGQTGKGNTDELMGG